jgi:hypothetical protein
MSPDVIAGIIAFIITLMVFSYLLGDNPLYRIATFLFVGVSAGYVASVAMWQVLWPRLFLPISTGTPDQQLMSIVPLVFFGLMLMKILPQLSKLGGPAMAYLVGVGAAVAIGGGVIGTLTPQIMATINFFDLRAAATHNIPFLELMFNGGFILVGTVTSLVYFQFGARTMPDGAIRRNGLVELLAWIGRIFIAIALGVIFAGVYAAALTALIERVDSIINFFVTLIGPK